MGSRLYESLSTLLGMSYPEPGPEVFYPGRTSKQTLLPPNTDEMFSFILRGVI